MKVFVLAKKIGSTSMEHVGKLVHVTLLELFNIQLTDVGNGSSVVVSFFDNNVCFTSMRVNKESVDLLNLASNLKNGAIRDVFVVDKFINISSKSKGKGFCGVMKRYGFGGGGASHGVSLAHRSQGSTGQCQDPGRVFKGKKMAGRVGNSNVTIKKLKILRVNNEHKCLFVKGGIPGYNGAVVKIQPSLLCI